MRRNGLLTTKAECGPIQIMELEAINKVYIEKKEQLQKQCKKRCRKKWKKKKTTLREEMVKTRLPQEKRTTGIERRDVITAYALRAPIKTYVEGRA